MSRGERAARRAAASGSGPTHDEPGRNPGAAGALALFGEVLLTGVLVTVCGLLVVTLPAALAAGIRHLRRYARAEGSSMRAFWGDVRAALPGGVVVGLACALIAGVLAIDILLASSGRLPGGELIAGFGWLLAAAVAGILLTASGAWSPESGWLRAIPSLPSAIGRDIPGFLYLVVAAAFVGLATWMLPPLLIPALGCAALAAVAVPERPRRRR
ncbi:DUF624 domain-containing protein [Microbacterium sp. JZ37]|uniref:DUF624 domain-containing protein n=1 Tax=Microbacterium sp. JZ37 TaxID=2654193 RepID=UPI002B47A002|nr:DUF624 domain-containing protein [Microbacterium sp. JZ37]WRH17010.1 DUF624 domain-containing protein [Microbacterium sp. JZ37]